MWRRRFLNRFLIRPIALSLLRPQYEGKENIPSDEPFILMVNHSNWVDPVVAGLVMYPREVMFMVKTENVQHRYLGLFFAAYGAVPVERGKADVSAIRRAVEVLTVDRDVLYVAPEGTRSGHGRLQQGKNGMAYVALRAGVPVLPVGVSGVLAFGDNFQQRRRTNVLAKVGHPFRFCAPPRRARRETLDEMTQEAMYQLAALLPPEQWGVYADMGRATEAHLDFLQPGCSNLSYAGHVRAPVQGRAPVQLAGALD
jgi:1-acyl-sn-glycerol-3-phosphate acyltransferase